MTGPALEITTLGDVLMYGGLAALGALGLLAVAARRWFVQRAR